MIFNPPLSFHRQHRSVEHLEDDKISLSSVNSLHHTLTPISASQISLSHTTILSQQVHSSPLDASATLRTSHHNIPVVHQTLPPNQTSVPLPRFVDKPILSPRLSRM